MSQDKNWFKVFPKAFLQDDKLKDIRIRGAFISVLALAKVSNNNGQFLDQIDEPMTKADIIRLSGISEGDYDCLIFSRLIDCNHKLHFVPNWLKYQSEYDRQKQYRSVVTKSTQETRDWRLEKEIETDTRDLSPKVTNSKDKPLKSVDNRPLPLIILQNEEDDLRTTLQKPNIGSDIEAMIKAQLNLNIKKQRQFDNKAAKNPFKQFDDETIETKE
jgi:hypothetical protein